MNNCNFVGRLCADPELRRTQDGTAVCSFSLAVKRPMVKDATDFIDVVAWRQSAEYLVKYGHKGDVVAVSGHLQIRLWEDKTGGKRRSAEVNATSVELLSSRRNAEASGNTTQIQNGYPGSTSCATHGNQSRINDQQYGNQSSSGYEYISDPDTELPF